MLAKHPRALDYNHRDVFLGADRCYATVSLIDLSKLGHDPSAWLLRFHGVPNAYRDLTLPGWQDGSGVHDFGTKCRKLGRFFKSQNAHRSCGWHKGWVRSQDARNIFPDLHLAGVH